MAEREILVADSDTLVREQITESLRKAGCQVETTASPVDVLRIVLEKQIPVVVLGTCYDKKIGLTDLIRLLKECNRAVSIILVSDEESLPVVRSIREEGIFYHALKPARCDDIEEIVSACESAFRNTGRHNSYQAPSRAKSPAPSAVPVAPRAMFPAAELAPQALPAAAKVDTTIESPEGSERKMKGTTAAVSAALIAAVAGCVYYLVGATKGMRESGDLLVWGFLGFCALIIVSQLIPVFFNFMAAKKIAEQRLQEELLSRKKQEAYAVSEKKE